MAALDADHVTTDQKVGGSHPPERAAHKGRSEAVSGQIGDHRKWSPRLVDSLFDSLAVSKGLRAEQLFEIPELKKASFASR